MAIDEAMHQPGSERKSKLSIVVVAAVVIEDGKVLLTQRKSGTHLAGAWEFPGGKVEPGEDPRAALRRELKEEIGVDALVGAPLEVTFHAYETNDVLLLFFLCEIEPNSARPTAIDVADVRWSRATDLRDEDFPPADVAVLACVRPLL